MYNYLKSSGSLYREYVGEDFYDNHWDDLILHISSSDFLPISPTVEQINDLDIWLKTSGSAVFRTMI
tara:strand:+ start:3709 stop:3909 length:201 start_codon:yes stop_codon:yes gene_type:complete